MLVVVVSPPPPMPARARAKMSMFIEVDRPQSRVPVVKKVRAVYMQFLRPIMSAMRP